jgi:hypothetical protein
VLIVTPGNLFLRKVFEANPLVDVEVRSDFPEQWPTDSLIVLHRDVPDQLPHGNLFVVDPTAGCDLWELGELLENPIITEQDQTSSLMTHVRLDNVLMPEARQLRFPTKPHVLAGALSGDPVYAQPRRASGKCLVLTVDLDRSDLAFRTAFPILVTNALGWFAGTKGELRESASTGSVIDVELDAGERQSAEFWTLRSPDGREVPLVPRSDASDTSDQETTSPSPSVDNPQEAVVQDTSLSVGPFDKCGVWSLEMGVAREAGDETARESLATVELAVNLADQRESDLRPRDELVARTIPEPTLAGWFARPVWFYLVAAVSALTILEWFLYQRRVI